MSRAAWLAVGAAGLALVAAAALFAGRGPQAAVAGWGFVDTHGAVVVPLGFEGARGFHGGRAAVMRDGRWGFVDRTGAWVVEPRFTQLCDFGGAEPTCAQDGQWGYIDATGAWVVEPRWAVALPMSDGLAAVGEVVGSVPGRDDTPQDIVHFGLIASDGQVVVPVRPRGDAGAWTKAGPWSEGLMAVEIGRRYGYVDRAGTLVIEPFFLGALPFRNGYAGVAGGRGWAVIARDGTLAVEEAHGFAEGASEGLLAGPTGYHGIDGEPVGPRFEWVRPHAEGLGAVMRDNRWGFVDTRVEPVIPEVFARVSDFADGRAVAALVVEKRFRWGILDREGAWVVEPTWSAVDESGFHEGLLAVRQGD
ncbi:MAG: WG repeat-containing protein [Alphaproteobacteria bacterium]|nr:WG repeat-containing protein [Alphaproteobacteria bacterium]